MRTPTIRFAATGLALALASVFAHAQLSGSIVSVAPTGGSTATVTSGSTAAGATVAAPAGPATTTGTATGTTTTTTSTNTTTMTANGLTVTGPIKPPPIGGPAASGAGASVSATPGDDPARLDSSIATGADTVSGGESNTVARGAFGTPSSRVASGAPAVGATGGASQVGTSSGDAFTGASRGDAVLGTDAGTAGRTSGAAAITPSSINTNETALSGTATDTTAAGTTTTGTATTAGALGTNAAGTLSGGFVGSAVGGITTEGERVAGARVAVPGPQAFSANGGASASLATPELDKAVRKEARKQRQSVARNEQRLLMQPPRTNVDRTHEMPDDPPSPALKTPDRPMITY